MRNTVSTAELTEIRSDHVEPDVQAQGREEAEELRFDPFGFLEENVDTQSQEGFGEIDGLENRIEHERIQN